MQINSYAGTIKQPNPYTDMGGFKVKVVCDGKNEVINPWEQGNNLGSIFGDGKVAKPHKPYIETYTLDDFGKKVKIEENGNGTYTVTTNSLGSAPKKEVISEEEFEQKYQPKIEKQERCRI